MNDPVVFPLDSIYGKESGYRISNRLIRKNAKYNRRACASKKWLGKGNSK